MTLKLYVFIFLIYFWTSTCQFMYSNCTANVIFKLEERFQLKVILFKFNLKHVGYFISYCHDCDKCRFLTFHKQPTFIAMGMCIILLCSWIFITLFCVIFNMTHLVILFTINTLLYHRRSITMITRCEHLAVSHSHYFKIYCNHKAQ